jgi:hypothetical protein
MLVRFRRAEFVLGAAPYVSRHGGARGLTRRAPP